MQYIGEQSAVLNWYCTKYATKAERGHANTTFTDITSTKSVASHLWQIALQGVSNRECGALEASDTLLGIPLYFTDPHTVIRWVDVNMVRSRRVKENHIITALPEDSEEILYPSMIYSYYPNRPHELEDMNLYDFLSWHDVVSKQPSDSTTYYPTLNHFLKKRQRPYLVSHYRYNPDKEPEKYYYSILLLFKPWRDCDSLIGDCGTYTEAFAACKDSLIDGLKYHDQLTRLREADAKVREQIRERQAEIKDEELDSSEPPGPLQYVATEVQNAMTQFTDVVSHDENMNIEEMISQLNEDQLRVFNKVRCTIQNQAEATTDNPAGILRLFVSGLGRVFSSKQLEDGYNQQQVNMLQSLHQLESLRTTSAV